MPRYDVVALGDTCLHATNKHDCIDIDEEEWNDGIQENALTCASGGTPFMRGQMHF